MRIARLLLLSLAMLMVGESILRADIPKTPTESPYVAPKGKALLVFVRERKRLAEEVVYSIVDERGRCIASVANDWKVVAPVRPGRQMLMVVTGVAQPQVQLLKVTTAADHTYVLKMRPRVNAKNPVELTILRRNTEPLEIFPASIRETGVFRSDLDACTAWVAKRQSKLTAKAAQAKEAWNAADKDFRASQTIVPSDGWKADEIVEP